MEQKLMWCPKCRTMVQSNPKLTPNAFVGLAVIAGGLMNIPLFLLFVPMKPETMGILGFLVVADLIAGAFFIRKGGLYRCSVCQTPTPSAQPPSGPTDFTRMNGQV